MARVPARRPTAQRSAPSLLVSLAVVLGVLALVCVLTAAVLYVKAKARPPLPETPGQSASRQTYHVPIAQQYLQIQQAAMSGVTQPVALDAGPEDVQTALAPHLRQRGIEDLRVAITDRLLVAQGRTVVHDQALWVTVYLQPTANNGQIALRLVDGEIGSLPMPTAVRSEVQRQLDRNLAGLISPGIPIRLDAVSVASGRLVIQGTVNVRP
ncbi:hypothetical protein LLH03_21630 [bacterium]|nr:hypothetical protein [bacterium]